RRAVRGFREGHFPEIIAGWPAAVCDETRRLYSRYRHARAAGAGAGRLCAGTVGALGPANTGHHSSITPLLQHSISRMIITQTPLRISFAGGGTDFREFYQTHGGAVVSSAIDKFVYCIVKERFDDRIYVNYSKKEIVDSVDQLEHELVRAAMLKT